MPVRWRLPMPSSIRAVVPGSVTPMRHDGSLALDALGVIDCDLDRCPWG
jgi:hypothetical protein